MVLRWRWRIWSQDRVGWIRLLSKEEKEGLLTWGPWVGSGRSLKPLKVCGKMWCMQISEQALFFLFFKFFLTFLFIFETERDRAWMGRGRERGRHRIRSRLQALSHQPRARRGARTPGPWDRDRSWSRMLNRLSHPGSPRVGFRVKKKEGSRCAPSGGCWHGKLD